MRTVLLNVFLALIWAASSGEVTLLSLVVGYVLGFLILWLTQPIIGSSRYVSKVRQLLGFTVYVVYHLIMANLRVVRDVLSPLDRLKPGIVQINLEAKTDGEITLLANVLSLMPGTLSLDVSDDRSHLYVHSMQLADRDQFESWIKDGLEPRILRLLR